MKYEVKFTGQFKKDLQKAQKQGKDLDDLFAAVEVLAEGGKLDPSYRDHDLTGEFRGSRECHIAPDWLLIYEIRHHVLVLMLYRTGSHADLFGK